LAAFSEVTKTITVGISIWIARGNYVMSANIAGFVKVADSMLDQGLV
jgi:hypothetical protein